MFGIVLKYVDLGAKKVGMFKEFQTVISTD